MGGGGVVDGEGGWGGMFFVHREGAKFVSLYAYTVQSPNL